MQDLESLSPHTSDYKVLPHQTTFFDENIYSYLLEELEGLIQPRFRAKQIYHWLYHHYENDISKMKNLPKDLQSLLQSKFSIVANNILQDKASLITESNNPNITQSQCNQQKIAPHTPLHEDIALQNHRENKQLQQMPDSQVIKQPLSCNKDLALLSKFDSTSLSPSYNTHSTISKIRIIKIEQSQDGTKKYLFETTDHFTFESVFIKMRDKVFDSNGKVVRGEKYTFCVSSQIGCKVGCVFCSTAKGGFVRNLSAGEIVEQVVALKRDNMLDSHKSINIVFMGMGEPLHNLTNVAKAIKILSHDDGLCIARRRQTISTSGVAPEIEKLGAMNLGVQIALSLHAVDDALRSKLIPMNKRYNIERILYSLKQFPLGSRNRILFEYLVIKDVNDDLGSAKKLVKLLHGFKAKVNLIPFNPHEESEFKRPSMIRLKEFADFLYHRGIVATIRESKGMDISAACGQLREKMLKSKSPH